MSVSNFFNEDSNSILNISLMGEETNDVANFEINGLLPYDYNYEVQFPEQKEKNKNIFLEEIITQNEKEEFQDINNIEKEQANNQTFNELIKKDIFTSEDNCFNGTKISFPEISTDTIEYFEDEHSPKKPGNKIEIKEKKMKKGKFKVLHQKNIKLRMDYAIKYIKMYISKYLKDYGNKLIKKCHFKNQLKKLKFFLPNYQYFTGNANLKKNNIFLNFTVEQILTYSSEKIQNKKDNHLQKQNKETMQALKEYIENNYEKEKTEGFQNLLNFFKMTYEDIIIDFYNSEYFEKFSSSKKTKDLDKIFLKSKGISLLEKNGFIKLVKKRKYKI